MHWFILILGCTDTDNRVNVKGRGRECRTPFSIKAWHICGPQFLDDLVWDESNEDNINLNATQK